MAAPILASAQHGIASAQQGGLKARVKIDTERVIGDIDPMIYGNFIEHLGAVLKAVFLKRRASFPTPKGIAKTSLEPPAN